MLDSTRPAKIVFLCSGGGGNLRFVYAASGRGWIGRSELVAVFTDRDCAANEFARAHGIETQVVDFSAEGQLRLLELLQAIDPAVIVTTVHKILRPELVRAFVGKLINLHYSLLPAFAGAIGVVTLRQALAHGVTIVGATAHWVDEGVDTGRPIVQAAVPLRESDSQEGLMDILFRAGCIALLAGLSKLLHRTGGTESAEIVHLDGRPVLFGPSVVARAEFMQDAFWQELKGLGKAEPCRG